MLVDELLNWFSFLLDGLLFELCERNIADMASVFEVELLWPSLVFVDFARRNSAVFLFEDFELFVDEFYESILEQNRSLLHGLTHHMSLMAH